MKNSKSDDINAEKLLQEIYDDMDFGESYNDPMRVVRGLDRKEIYKILQEHKEK